MAFSTRITAYDHAGNVLLELEPRWWSADELMKDPRFSVTCDMGSYYDYDLNLTLKEARVMHAHFKPRTETGLQMAALESALYEHADTLARFHVSVFEWESGLG
jgi:hypothetical protein